MKAFEKRSSASNEFREHVKIVRKMHKVEVDAHNAQTQIAHCHDARSR